VPREPVSSFCDRDLLSHRQLHSDEAKLEPTDLSQETNYKLASSLRHVPRVAIYTLAALAAGDFSHQALAMSAVDPAYEPPTQEAGNLVVPAPTEESATKEAVRTSVSSAIASPESLLVQEFAPASSRVSEHSITQPAQDAQKVVPSLVSPAPLATSTDIAPPETEVIQARTSAQQEPAISVPGSSAPQPASATRLASVQNRDVQNLQEVLSPAQSAMPITNSYAPTSQATANPQQSGEVVAQAVSKKSCLADARASQETANLQQTSAVVAQRQPTASCLEVENLQNQLRALEELEVKGEIQASPALSIVIPTGFGADKNTGFISATYQQRTRYANVDDGGLGIGIGLGDAQKAVGVELSYALASFGGSRDFGAGGFNVKVHRQLGNDWAVAAGWNGFLNIGGDNDFENSLYGVVSKVFRTRDDINLPLSRVAVTAGVGTGQFQTESALDDDSDGVNVFGNVAVRVAQPVSLIAEWSGEDLGVGVSIAPFKNIPLVITPAVRDLVGAGDGPRFVLGTGFAFKF
jgi:hypothetical protein